MASLPPHQSTQPSPSPKAHPHATASGTGDESPTLQDASADTILISSPARSLGRTQQPANTPLATDQDSTSAPVFPETDSSSAPPEQTAPTPPSPSSQQNSQPTASHPPLARQSTSNEPKQCWICFGDSTEDDPEASPWRTPCPCALTAHEACLLDWIADLEAPAGSTSQTSRRRKSKIQCPQCKAEIQVARPWSPVVATVRAVERITGTMILPGVATVFLGGVFSACFVHGAISVLLVLGAEDWARLIGASADGRPTQVGARLTLGLPAIPIVLILSRTKLADGLLPVLPILFFAPHLNANRLLHRLAASPNARSTLGAGREPVSLWPPSAAAAFASLPYLRAFYNAAYRKLFAEKQSAWLKAVQREPRPGEEDARIPDDGVEDDLEIQIVNENGGVADHEAVEQAIDEAVRAAEERERDQGRIVGGQIPPAGNEEQRPNVPGQRRDQGRQNNTDLVLSASKIADTVLGALCFPFIASVMGEALKLSLPTRWTAASLARRPGLLQSKWGRSIVGGCLFVAMKDAFLLYSHYRLAHDHQKRQVLDHKGGSIRTRNKRG